MVKVAYVDTEGGPVPSQIGQIKGTPTIKAFVPQRKSARNEKTVVEYDQAREVGDLVRFATSRMPNFVEMLNHAPDLAAFDAKAMDWQLPRVLVFSNRVGQTASTLKALSSEYRRRVLIGELREKGHADEVARYDVTSFPTLLCLPPPKNDMLADAEPLMRFENKDASYRRLDAFVSRCALRQPHRTKPIVPIKEPFAIKEEAEDDDDIKEEL